SRCYQKNLAHLKHFVHPGDRHYRMGLVHFPTRKGVRVQKEFPTLRDLFNFCDPDESGNISKEEFQGAWDLLVDLPPAVFGMEGTSLKGSPEQAWESAAGDERSHLTFAQFAKWAADMKIQLPVGVDPSDAAAAPWQQFPRTLCARVVRTYCAAEEAKTNMPHIPECLRLIGRAEGGSKILDELLGQLKDSATNFNTQILQDRPCRFQYKDRCPCVNFKVQKHVLGCEGMR
ncbi:unnamed protein product, partial [Symbiodinium necroappetens]